MTAIQMSELDAVEAVSALLANAMTSFTVYFSFTFAYLTVCYLAGARLSKFQAIAVSILYIVSASSTGMTVIGNQRAIEQIQISFPSIVIDRLLMFDMSFWHAYAGTLFIAIAALSLYFMYDCRRLSKIKNEGAA
jgi:hypothetical protein